MNNLKPVASEGPKGAYIEATTRCNMRCKYCPHYYSTFGDDMPEAIVHKAIGALVAKVDTILIAGLGEPLISKSFFTILEACEQNGVRLGFPTNGIRLRDERLVERLVRAPVQICVSIDGARPETYNFMRPEQEWDRLLQTLALVQRCRKKVGPKFKGATSFLCVAMKDTFGDLPDLVCMAHEYGVSQIQVQALSDGFPGQSPFNTPNVTAPALLEGMAVARKFGVSLNLPSSLYRMACDHVLVGDALWRDDLTPGAKHILSELLFEASVHAVPKDGISPCRHPWDWTFIDCTGKVRACCLSQTPLGDLNTENWNDIWNGTRYQNFRRLVHSWNPPIACRKCFFPDGINDGDTTRYERYFAQFRSETISLDSDQAKFDDEFERIEEEKGKYLWHLKNRSGAVSLSMHHGSRFLCFAIEGKGSEHNDFTFGTCKINDGQPEPFDLSCDHLFFPLNHVFADRLDVRFEMEGFGNRKLVIRGASLLL